MNDETGPSTDKRECGRQGRHHRLSRKVRLAVAAAVLLGLGATAGGLATLSASAGAHMFGGHHAHDPQHAVERVRDRAAWVLGRLDATPGQEAQVDAVVSELMADLAPLGEAHRGHRRILVSQLLRSDVDPVRLEEVRLQELELADRASARVLDAMVRMADILTPAQREELMEWVADHAR